MKKTFQNGDMIQRLELEVEWEASAGNKNTFPLEVSVVTETDRGPLSRIKYVIMARTPADPRQCCDFGKEVLSAMVLMVLLSRGMEDWDWIVKALGFPRSAFGLSSGIHSSGILGDTSDTGRHCFRHRVPRGSWSYVPSIILHLVACCVGNNIECSLSQPRVTTGSFAVPPLTCCLFRDPRVVGILAKHRFLSCCIASDVYYSGRMDLKFLDHRIHGL